MPVSHPLSTAPTDAPIRVVVADDHERFREGLVRRLRRDPRFDVVATGTCGASAVVAITTHRPDVAVLDLRLPIRDALEVWERVRAVDVTLGRSIMVLTATPDDPRAIEVREAIEGAVRGKDATRGELADAIAAHDTRWTSASTGEARPRATIT